MNDLPIQCFLYELDKTGIEHARYITTKPAVRATVVMECHLCESVINVLRGQHARGTGIHSWSITSAWFDSNLVR